MATPSSSSSMLDLHDHHYSNNMEHPDDDKLTYEIFSILENNFLFGNTDHDNQHGKVRILSIDDGGSTDGLLAAKTILRLQSILRTKSGNPTAQIADFFDVVTGAGIGGLLAGLLFTRAKHGSVPLFTADESLKFIVDIMNGRRRLSPCGIFRRTSKSAKMLKKVFGDLTLKDTLKAVLIPCYDLTTGAPFMFSRADALEMDGCDFLMRDVCGATTSDRAVELRSTEGKTNIVAVGSGRVGMSNPTAAAITHVLNNKQEFPVCKGVEDLLVLSLGNGISAAADSSCRPRRTTAAFLKITGDGAADMVDEAVSMAFGESRRSSNYVRIQGTAGSSMADEIIMLGEKNVESILFKGKKLGENTNMEKLEMFARDLIKEEERRNKTAILPNVILKQYSNNSPRSSSATTLSTFSSCN